MAAPICATCNSIGELQQCPQCQSIWYCSPMCRIKDVACHELVCGLFAAHHAGGPPAPSRQHHLGILFDPAAAAPSLVWAPFESLQNPVLNTDFEMLDRPRLPAVFRDLLPLVEVPWSETVVTYNSVRERPTRGWLTVASLDPGARALQQQPDNMAISAATQGRYFYPWKGPVVAVIGTRGATKISASLKHRDMTAHDFKDLVDFLGDLGNPQLLEQDPANPANLAAGVAAATTSSYL